MATLHILAQTIGEGITYKVGKYVTTDISTIAPKATELGIVDFTTETVETTTTQFPHKIYNGIEIPEDNFVSEIPFFIEIVDETEFNNQQLAGTFANGLLFNINANSLPLPSVKLPDEIVTHPFIVGVFTGTLNEFYDYGEVGFKAILPIPYADLLQFTGDEKNWDKFTQLKSEMEYYQQFANRILYKYELKRLTENPTLTYTQFLDDPAVQAEIVAEIDVDPAQVPLLLEIYETYNPPTP